MLNRSKEREEQIAIEEIRRRTVKRVNRKLKSAHDMANGNGCPPQEILETEMRSILKDLAFASYVGRCGS